MSLKKTLSAKMNLGSSSNDEDDEAVGHSGDAPQRRENLKKFEQLVTLSNMKRGILTDSMSSGPFSALETKEPPTSKTKEHGSPGSRFSMYTKKSSLSTPKSSKHKRKSSTSNSDSAINSNSAVPTQRVRRERSKSITPDDTSQADLISATLAQSNSTPSVPTGRRPRRSSTLVHSSDSELRNSIQAISTSVSDDKKQHPLKSSRWRKPKPKPAEVRNGSEVYNSWFIEYDSGTSEYKRAAEFKPKLIKDDTFGWHIEAPASDFSLEYSEVRIEYKQFEASYYLENFYQKDHVNYVAQDKTLGNVVASVRKDRESGLATVILRCRKFVCIMQVSISNLKKTGSKAILKDLAYNEGKRPNMTLVNIKQIQDPDAQEALVKFEKSEIFKRYKIGVLPVNEGQKTDDQFFSNTHGSERYDEFLTVLGQKVELLKFSGYAGGLDTSQNMSTGTHSVYTSYFSMDVNYEIMYHVSTYLPFQEDDLQRVERKRHLGNDVVNVIYNDSGLPFDPTTIVTNFIHVYIVVQADEEATKERGEVCYRVEVAKQDGVPEFGPPLPDPPIIPRSDMRHWLIPKIINAERAGLTAPAIRFTLASTRKILIDNLVDSYSA